MKNKISMFFTSALAVVFSGCSSVPEYEVTRQLSPAEYAKELIREHVVADHLVEFNRDYTEETEFKFVVRQNTVRSVRTAGQFLSSMITYCTKTGGYIVESKRFHVTKKVAVVGCTYKDPASPEFSLHIMEKSSINSHYYTPISVTLQQSKPGKKTEFIEYLKNTTF